MFLERVVDEIYQNVCVFLFCFFDRSTHAYSAYVQVKMAGFSSTVQVVWPVMTMESSLQVW